MSECSLNRRQFIREMGAAGALLIAPFSPGSSPSAPASQTLQQLKSGWQLQPYYRFTTELIEGAGLSHRPETEVCTARFETVADPRKAVASGARFYGREIVSAEAYTFLHPERYRATPEVMKRATDAQLRPSRQTARRGVRQKVSG